MATKLEQVIRDKNLAANLVAAGKRTVEQYRWCTVAQQVERVYQQARQAYPVKQLVIPGWRWLARFIPSQRKAMVRVPADE